MIIVKGSDAVVQVTLLEKNVQTGRMDPTDLSGKTLSVVFKSATALVTIEGEDITVVDERLAKFTFNIDKTVTEALKVGDLPFDVHVEDEDEEVEIWKFKNELTVEDRIR